MKVDKAEIFISPGSSIREALKRLDKTAEKTLIVVDENSILLGTLTDGDIRRYIIETGKIDGNIDQIYNHQPVVVRDSELNEEKVKRIMLQNRIEVLPVISDSQEVVGYFSWTEVFSGEVRDKRCETKNMDVPVVIMAGGKGSRLSPFTQVLPKPLIPVGEKTLIENVIESFRVFGVNRFFLTLNYKGELIEVFFKGRELDYEVNFIWEEEYLGTAGSLSLVSEYVQTDREIIVSNCDILVSTDFYQVYQFHKEKDNVLTSITVIQNQKIPYGVVKTRHGGTIEDIEEKPEYLFQINSGVYVMNTEILDFVPRGRPYDMPDLIKKLLSMKLRVGAFPISNADYVDVGRWEELETLLKKLG